MTGIWNFLKVLFQIAPVEERKLQAREITLEASSYNKRQRSLNVEDSLIAVVEIHSASDQILQFYIPI